MIAPVKIERSFLPTDFSFETWEELLPFFKSLDERQITDVDELRAWLNALSELEAFFYENMAWRYIRQTTDTENEDYNKAYEFFVKEIRPQAAPFFDRFNRKLLSANGAAELEKDPGYAIMLRNTRKSAALFRQENVPLEAEVSTRASDYGRAVGRMSIEFEGTEYTLPQASALLDSPDRNQRKTVYRKLADRRLQDFDSMNELLSDLINTRHQIALNAGFENYRDYMFDELQRFDYTPADTFQFHKSIETEMHSVVAHISEQRCKAIGIDALQQYDLAFDYRGSEPLKPFVNEGELIAKGTEVLRRVHPFFGECLQRMAEMNHLDLASRPGKSPGGYNYPLYESGYPFIFMNAAGTQRDLSVLVHEAGHAVHAVLCQSLELTFFKNCPSEVAELVSMSMELISMDHWDVFYEDPKDLKRAKLQQLEQSVDSLGWIATIDCFQHWLYENPTHSADERTEAWREIYLRFQGDIDWEGFEDYRDAFWQRQLHIYDVPFYYIEYGIAQLGALAIYRNYKNNPEKALQQYTDALKLGNTRSIPEVYEAAGIRFDFSAEYIRDLAAFALAEIERVEQE